MAEIPGGESKDYYQRLGVGQNADRAEVVSAYRRLVVTAHPDSCPDDPNAAARFRLLTEAYEVLTDAKLRLSYDQIRSSDPGGQAGVASGPGGTQKVVIPVKRRSTDSGEVFRAGPVRQERPDAARQRTPNHDRGEIRERTSAFSDEWRWR
jgi:curved DNA-binding protein CbpA